MYKNKVIFGNLYIQMYCNFFGGGRYNNNNNNSVKNYLLELTKADEV